MDLDDRVDDLLLANALDNISRLEIHGDRVTGRSDLMALTLDLAERGLEAVLSEIHCQHTLL